MTRRLLMAAAAVLLVPCLAVAAPQATVAEARVGGASVDFAPQVDFGRAVLTVSTPTGQVLRFEGVGTVPSFGLYDAKGQARPDGLYQWELRLSPRMSPELRKELRAARTRGEEGNLGDRVVSGAFTIAGGSFVDPGAREAARGATTEKAITPTTAADQVIPDDLIVQGSECVGLDCVNNENFGFDTIRMKENNTRIHFDDTSTQVGFPAFDWRLIANDSASGGSNKFSIEDSTSAKTPFTITGGASTNSIFVDSIGRIGLRTSTPVLDLHINTSNTPAIRLEQNNSGGFTAQTWDIGANEANFFVRDVTSGSLLSFRIRPGAPTSSLDVSSDGEIGIGTGGPSQKVHVFQNADVNTISLVENDSAGQTAAAAFRAQNDTGVQTNFIAHGSGRIITRYGVSLASRGELLHTGGNGLLIGTLEADNIILGTNNANRLEIAGTGAVTIAGNLTVNGTFSNPSSIDFKEAFVPVDASGLLTKLAMLPINEWSYKNDELGLRHVGPTVEDFQRTFGLGTEGKHIFPLDVQGVTIAAVQGLYQLVQEKDAEIAELRAQIGEIKQLLERAGAAQP